MLTGRAVEPQKGRRSAIFFFRWGVCSGATALHALQSGFAVTYDCSLVAAMRYTLEGGIWLSWNFGFGTPPCCKEREFGGAVYTGGKKASTRQEHRKMGEFVALYPSGKGQGNGRRASGRDHRTTGLRECGTTLVGEWMVVFLFPAP